MYVYIYIYTYIYTCLCVCVHISLSIYMYTYIYIYTHTYAYKCPWTGQRGVLGSRGQVLYFNAEYKSAIIIMFASLLGMPFQG